MPAGYVIAQLRVTNQENYKEYIEKVNPIVKNLMENFQLEMVNIKYLMVKLNFQE